MLKPATLHWDSLQEVLVLIKYSVSLRETGSLTPLSSSIYDTKTGSFTRLGVYTNTEKCVSTGSLPFCSLSQECPCTYVEERPGWGANSLPRTERERPETIKEGRERRERMDGTSSRCNLEGEEWSRHRGLPGAHGPGPHSWSSKLRKSMTLSNLTVVQSSSDSLRYCLCH